jgi:O-antigen ligase
LALGLAEWGRPVTAAVAQWSTFVGLLGKSTDLTHRIDISPAVVDRFAERRILGSGFVRWWPSWDPWFAIHSVEGQPMSQAHNVWLDIAMQSGFVGVVLFAVTLVFALWHLWRTFVVSPRSTTTVLFVVLCALTVQSLTESRLLHEWGFVTLIACVTIAERIRAGTTAKR